MLVLHQQHSTNNLPKKCYRGHHSNAFSIANVSPIEKCPILTKCQFNDLRVFIYLKCMGSITNSTESQYYSQDC